MKITKKFLREMILLEIGDYIDSGLGVGGKEMMRSDFQSTNFEDNVARIQGLLEDMETNVRDDETIGADELNNLKNVYLTILHGKIKEVEEAITKKVSPVAAMQREPNEYRGKFARNMMMIVPLLDKMKDDVVSNTQYKKQDLEYFKNNHLDNLMRKIGFLEGAIDARLSGKFDEIE
jgi:hypothetical protein